MKTFLNQIGELKWTIQKTTKTINAIVIANAIKIVVTAIASVIVTAIVTAD